MDGGEVPSRRITRVESPVAAGTGELQGVFQPRGIPLADELLGEEGRKRLSYVLVFSQVGNECV